MPAREILGRVPHWTLRYGLGSLALLVVLAIGLAATFRYPDVIEARARVVAVAPPITLSAPMNGRVLKWHAEEGQHVAAGEVIGRWQGRASDDDMSSLQAWYARLPNDPDAPLPADLVVPESPLRLGEVQVAYAAFRRQLEEHRQILLLEPVQVESAPLELEIAATERRIEAQQAQTRSLDLEASLLHRSHQRQLALAADGLAAAESITESERAIVRSAFARETIEAELAASRVDLARIERQRARIRLDHERQSRERGARIAESRRLLEAAIDDWEIRHRLTAPASGVIFLQRAVRAHQATTEGEWLASLVPDADRTPDAVPFAGHRVHVDIPAAGAGRVATGDRVLLRLDAWPHQEFGELSARVTHAARLPGPNGYRIEATLEPIRHGARVEQIVSAGILHGDARIVVRDRGFLARLLDTILGS